MNRYDDIIDMPHHVSPSRQRMSMPERAAQFAPFAALTGYESAVEEVARQTAERRELDAQEVAELNRRLAFLTSKLSEKPIITIEYFIPDDRRPGGSYATVTGIVKKISTSEQLIVFIDGATVSISDILSIHGRLFDVF